MSTWFGLALLLQVLASPRPLAKVMDGGAPPEMLARFTEWLRQGGYEVSIERWTRTTPIGGIVYSRDLPGAEKIAGLLSDAEARPLLWESPFDLIAVLGQGAAPAPAAAPPAGMSSIRLVAEAGFLSPLFGKDLTVTSYGGREQTTRAAPLLRGSLGIGLPHPFGTWLDVQTEAFVYAAADHTFVGPAARVEARLWKEDRSSVSLAAEAGAAFNAGETLPGSFDTALVWGAGPTFAQSMGSGLTGAFSAMYVFLPPRYGRPSEVFKASSRRLDLSGPQVGFRLSWKPD